MNARTHRYGILVLLSICVGLSAVAVALGSSGAGGSDRAAGDGTPADARFAVLRSAGTPADAIEQRKIARGIAATSDNRDERADIRLVRRDGAHKVHVATTGDEICLAVREADGSGSLGCTPLATDDGSRPLSSVNSLGRGATRFVALMVDGIDSVKITTADGQARTVDVRNNVVDVILHDPLEHMSWETPAGVTRELRAAPAR